MRPSLVQRLEKTLVFLLLLSFALPRLIGWALLLPQTHGPGASWLRNTTLGGMVIAPADVRPTARNLLSAKYQKAFANGFDLHFAGREGLIRLTNELNLRAFHTISAGTLAGRHLSLFQPGYVEEYCLKRGSDRELRPLAEDLRRVQDLCAARGIAFAFVVTPNKAAINPEDLPPEWLRRYKPGLRYHDVLLPLLREKGIRFVDGHQLTAKLKTSVTWPVFPDGGLHWSGPAGLLAGNAMLSLLAAQGLDVAPVTDFRIELSNVPAGRDFDLANLNNLAFPMRYPVATLVLPLPTSPGPNPPHPNAVVVGGSFSADLMQAFSASRRFSEITYLYYYHTERQMLIDGETHLVATPAPPPDFTRDIFSADALVLEANEETLPSGAPHVRAFLRDALAAAPGLPLARAPFRGVGTWQDYQWGEKFSFVRADANCRPTALTGFSAPTEHGVDTIGPRGSVRLLTPPPPGDMVIEVEAAAYLIGDARAGQRVSVAVNGRAVGEWVWRSGASVHQEIRVPREDLIGGETRLDFTVAHPGPASEFGPIPGKIRHGIALTALWVRPAAK